MEKGIIFRAIPRVRSSASPLWARDATWRRRARKSLQALAALRARIRPTNMAIIASKERHGPIHVYVGGVNGQGDPGDMTDFETAGRDPIFFAHHANLDRLWEIVKANRNRLIS
jgi:Common central domain of tyrosinase